MNAKEIKELTIRTIKFKQQEEERKQKETYQKRYDKALKYIQGAILKRAERGQYDVYDYFYYDSENLYSNNDVIKGLKQYLKKEGFDVKITEYRNIDRHWRSVMYFAFKISWK